MDGATAETPPYDVLGDLTLRLTQAGRARLTQSFLTVVSGIHGLVTDLRPTSDELKAVIDFLTDVGHSADARRQEWVLLADVIGVSTHVEDLNSPRPRGATPNTLPGPFYREDVPDLPSGANLSRDGIGESLSVEVQLCDLAGNPVRDALIEVWQANASGRYENQDPDLQPEFNLRGRFRCNAEGMLHFRTVKPHGYALPEDGPVGRLLNSLGLRLERPAHLHFRVTAAGFQTLTTHIFDRADPAIGHDALFGVRPELLADFRPLGTAGHALDLTLVLAPEDQAPGPDVTMSAGKEP